MRREARPPILSLSRRNGRSTRTCDAIAQANQSSDLTIVNFAIPASDPNFVDVDKDLYKRKGIYPIMHTVAIKKSVYERYPFVATSLYDAFVKSKNIALAKLFNLRAVRYMTPFLMREIDDIWEVFDGDPWPYGVEPNRRTIEALITYQQTLGLTDKPVKVDDLFVPTYG